MLKRLLTVVMAFVLTVTITFSPVPVVGTDEASAHKTCKAQYKRHAHNPRRGIVVKWWVYKTTQAGPNQVAKHFKSSTNYRPPVKRGYILC